MVCFRYIFVNTLHKGDNGWWWYLRRHNFATQNCCCQPTVLLTYLLHGAEFFFEKLTGSQLVRKVLAMYGTRRFITAFTSARHPSLSWASLMKSIPLHTTSWRSILILSSQVVSFLQVSPPKPCPFLSSTPYTPTVLQSVKTHKNIDWALPAMRAWRN